MSVTIQQLDKHELAATWERYRDTNSITDRNRLAEHYLPLVLSLAYRLLAPDAPYSSDDLVSEGSVGLLRAIERYDPDRGVSFVAFARTRIHGAMRDGMRAIDWLPRQTRRQKNRDNDPGPLWISLNALNSFVRRDWPDTRKNDSSEIPDAITTADEDRPERPAEETDWWREACRGLSTTERLILLMYYRNELTMKQVARSIGRSESSVSQILATIHRRLRERLRPDSTTYELQRAA